MQAERQTIAVLAILMLACLPVDHAVALWAAALPDGIHQVAHVMAILGRSVWILGPFGLAVLLLFVVSRIRPEYLHFAKLCGFVFACVAVSGLAVNAIKPFFGRPRPHQWLLDPAIVPQPFSGSAKFASFPSGHTDAATALALSLGIYYPRLRLPLLGWAALMGISRVLGNDHYPSDVVGGALVGAATTFALTWLARKRGWFNRPDGRDRGRA